MIDALIELLDSFGYQVMQQGSLLPDEPYPDTFITYWNNSTTDDSFYDNSEHRCIWSFTVNCYSVSPNTVETLLSGIKALLKQHGWIVSGKGYDVPSDEPSSTGRAIDILYAETIQEENT